MLILSLYMLSVSAQESVTSAGGDASSNDGSVCYSVGQVFYTTQSNATGTIITGVQQAFEIFEITGLDRNLTLDLELSVYPNPTAEMVTLSISEYKDMDLSYQLFDIQGKLLKDQELSDSRTIIDMTELIASSYILKIMNQNQASKTFKIIKN